ncbi:hypothetical protein [Pseudomonas sp. LP_7_YM]|uniref:hypothetical protein n=1 Tax=Pseudomonas sp. LP_7_YM TaxID=2485137 RepID=UPI0010615A85|nr:hypothetical protein [Pseudomonas sp. LP_7_YM]
MAAQLNAFETGVKVCAVQRRLLHEEIQILFLLQAYRLHVVSQHGMSDGRELPGVRGDDWSVAQSALIGQRHAVYEVLVGVWPRQMTTQCFPQNRNGFNTRDASARHQQKDLARRLTGALSGRCDDIDRRQLNVTAAS